MGETTLELNIGKLHIVINFSFPMILAWIFLQKDAELIKQILAVSMIHETGHGLAMCLTKAGIREIRFYAAGIRMQTNAYLLSTGKILAVYLSGPVMNLCFALLFWKMNQFVAILHLWTGIFNLLPYRVLDGGAAWENFFEMKTEWLDIRKKFCLILSMAILFLLFFRHIQNLALYLMIIYLTFCEISVDKL